MSDFKLVDEGEHHLTLAHPDGHQVKLAKSALSKATLSKFKKMAEGGEVQIPGSDEEKKKVSQGFNNAMGTSKGPNNPKLQQSTAPQREPIKLAGGGKLGLDEVADPTAGLTQENPNVPPDYTAAATPTNTPAPQTSSSSFLSNVAQGVSNPDAASAPMGALGISPAQNESTGPPQNVPLTAQNPKGSVQPASYQTAADEGSPQPEQTSQQDKLGNLLSNAEHHYKQLDNEAQDLKQKIQSGQIDPNRLFHDMNTGQKIQTGIAMILGGFAGFGHQQNPVMQFIDKQMQNDIEAQKADLGKNTTLLEANLKEHGNLRDAIDATMAQYKAATEGMLGLKAAATMGPLGIANHNNLLQQAQMSGEMLRQQLAYRKSLNENGNFGTQSAGYNPGQRQQNDYERYEQQRTQYGQYIKYSGLVDPKDQNEYMNELDRVINARQQAKDIKNAFDKTGSQNTLGNRAMHLGFQPQSVNSFINLITPLLRDRDGKLNVQELDNVKGMIHSPGDGTEKTAQKDKDMTTFLTEKQGSSKLASIGIHLPPPSMTRNIQTSPQFKQVGYKQ